MPKNDAGVKADDLQAPEGEQELKTDAGAPQGQEGEVDYKELLEQALERENNYKIALTQKRQLRKEAPKDSEVTDEDDDKAITRKELRKILQEEITPVVAGSKIDQALDGLVKDPNKRALVKHYYENRIRQMGTSDDAIRTDVQTALDLVDSEANRKKALETARAANQQKVPPMSGSSSDNAPEPKNHKFSDEQTKVLTAQATRIGADPKKFIAEAWKNQQKG